MRPEGHKPGRAEQHYGKRKRYEEFGQVHDLDPYRAAPVRGLQNSRDVDIYVTSIVRQGKIHVTLMDCENDQQGLGVAAVKNTPWQIRLKAAGLTQKRLAEILGAPENTVSRQMRGEWTMPGYVVAVIAAWEIMSPAERERWLKMVKDLQIDGP